MLTQAKKFIRDLGDGLILRHASPEDADALSEFNGEIHAEDEADKLRLIAWTRDLLTRPSRQSMFGGRRQATSQDMFARRLEGSMRAGVLHRWHSGRPRSGRMRPVVPATMAPPA